LVAGPGDASDLFEKIDSRYHPRITFLGMLSDEQKRQFFKSVDLYVAPNTGGESFGIILAEAMATGTAILASDLEAFRFVLEDGKWGRLFRNGDGEDLADQAIALLDDPELLLSMAEQSSLGAERFDWPVVARAILDVYEFITPADEGGNFEKVRLASEGRARGRLPLTKVIRSEGDE
jgi:phosphatidylinositol alpha-mannosyltransferase